MGVVAMIRRVVMMISVLTVAAHLACAGGVSGFVSFGPPTIVLDSSETQLATRTATISLPQGDTRLALPLAEMGIAPADATLELSPTGDVAVSSVYTDAEGTYWTVHAVRDQIASIRLTYPVEGLTWSFSYTAALGADGSVALSAALHVANSTGHPLQDARLTGEFARAAVSLDNGQSLTLEQPWLNATVGPEHVSRALVYDTSVSDTPVELLTIAGGIPQRATALPAGPVRIYAAPEVGGEFLTQTTIAYTPPREPIELNLGPAAGILITRKLTETKEVDKRLDARDRVVLFDLLETWEVEARNLRNEPVELLVREHHEGAWTLEEISVEADRSEAETFAFSVPLLPDEPSQITYQLRHHNRQP
jgi:hypothetical protein